MSNFIVSEKLTTFAKYRRKHGIFETKFAMLGLL